MPTSTDHRELLQRLAEGVGQLTTSSAWRRHLELQARFHRYSSRNVVLIGLQRPDATRVAGFRAWRALRRHVCRGERAIWILAPILERREDLDTGEREAIVRGFRFVPVFDVAQTDGEPLASVCDLLVGDDERGAYAALVGVAETIGFRVEDHDFAGAANGDCSHATRRIRVEAANAPAQRVKTLAHELGHALMHARCEDRALAELEAESVAYVACAALGIDSSRYSFGYLAAWAGGSDAANDAITGSCDRIQRAAATILDACLVSGALAPTKASACGADR